MSRRSSLFESISRKSSRTNSEKSEREKEVDSGVEHGSQLESNGEGDVEKDFPNESFKSFKSFDDHPVTESDLKNIVKFYADDRIKNMLSDPSILSSSFGKRAEAKEERLALKFIRGKHNHVSKAVDSFVATARWRVENDVDNALSWGFEKIELAKELYPHSWHGWDKKGRPVYIERLGMLNVKKLAKEVNVEQYARYHILHWEYANQVLFKKATESSGRPVDEIVSILDLKGVGTTLMHPTCGEFFKQIMKIDDEYYPESGVMFIVNVPWIFSAIWSIVGIFVGSRAREKVRIVRGKNVKDELIKFIDAKYLPDFLGGTSKWREAEEESHYIQLCLKKDGNGQDILPNNK